MDSSRAICARWWRLGREFGCAAGVAAFGLVAAIPSFAGPPQAAPPAQHDVATETAETVTRVLLPAVSKRWSPDLLLFVLGHPWLVTIDGPDLRTRWLIHSQQGRRLIVEVAGREVIAAQLTVRTTTADAHDIAMASLSALLGPPRRSGSHDARWSSKGVEVRLAGWRGEFNVELRRR